MQTFLDYEKDFGGANRVLIAVMAKDGDMFDQDFIPPWRTSPDVIAIDATDDARVRSIFTPNVRFVEVVEDGFAGGNVIPSTFTPSLPAFDARRTSTPSAATSSRPTSSVAWWPATSPAPWSGPN
jgi:uncharacterized protein